MNTEKERGDEYKYIACDRIASDELMARLASITQKVAESLNGLWIIYSIYNVDKIDYGQDPQCRGYSDKAIGCRNG